jgi:hypothetical protein
MFGIQLSVEFIFETVGDKRKSVDMLLEVLSSINS